MSYGHVEKQEHTRWLVMGGAILTVVAFLFAVGQSRLQSRLASASLMTPEMGTIEGSIASLSILSSVPSLQLHTRSGGTVEVVLDSQETVVLRNGQVQTLDHLSKGQRVKAYMTQKDGRSVANSIVILAPPATFPPAKIEAGHNSAEAR